MRDYSGMTETELEEAGAELIEDTYRDSVTELLAVTLRGIAFGLALVLLFSRTSDGEHFGAVHYAAVFVFGVLQSVALAAGGAYLKAMQEDAEEKLPLSSRFRLRMIGAARCIPYCIDLVERVFRLGRLVRAFHKYDKANRRDRR